MSTRETKARAGPVCDVRREVFALVRVVLLTRCHCVAMAGELYEAGIGQPDVIECAGHTGIRNLGPRAKDS